MPDQNSLRSSSAVPATRQVRALQELITSLRKVTKPGNWFAVFLLLASGVVSMLVPDTQAWAQSAASNAESNTSLPAHVIEQFGESPAVPTGPVDDTLKQAMDVIFIDFLDSTNWGTDESIALTVINKSEDPRIGWLIADMMRFVSQTGLIAIFADSATELLGITFKDGNVWGLTTDHLMAWDIPPPPDYLTYKRHIFTSLIPGWENIFVEGDIDWRHVSWGGVLIDARAYNETLEPCNCIPAADNPEVTDVAGATWLKDDDIVFGVNVGDEYRAYPRQIMEVREMVNDTLGGRHLGMPYCTLCGSMQAYFTDDVPDDVERPVLRTSGLLIRSNKVMYDINTYSVFDTFLGTAVTGPLAEKGIKLEQAGVVTTDWGTWKKAYPQTTVLKEEYALGRNPDFRNNRDANGPIFPVGDVDPRLPVHEDVVGVVTASGKPVAFHRAKALAALIRGETVTYENIKLKLEGGGVKAVDTEGGDLGGHQAFWFAWSQFYPDTDLWQGS